MLSNQYIEISRHQIWCRLEENGHISMKIPPSQIEFTLPSPKIGIETLPMVDPAWMPKSKTKVKKNCFVFKDQMIRICKTMSIVCIALYEH